MALIKNRHSSDNKPRVHGWAYSLKTGLIKVLIDGHKDSTTSILIEIIYPCSFKFGLIAGIRTAELTGGQKQSEAPLLTVRVELICVLGALTVTL